MLGKAIRETRLKLGLTQEGLGKRANLHYSYIGQVERGNKVPSIKTLKRIAAALNVNVEDLLKKEPSAMTSDEDILIKELVNSVKDCSAEELKLYINIIKQIRCYLQELNKGTPAT
ncbi:helix-turn-helix transcriptional regulator [Desulfallas sp. Bu1-1]|nr:helix-turn-helix transcriptional regulator [Desulfallas sp. Bu1-1]